MWKRMVPALLRLAGIGAFCAFVYLAGAAFVPAMETARWDFLFIGLALMGIVAGVSPALRDVVRKARRR